MAAGALVVFHAVLFARRLRDLTILEPVVVLQWAGTVALLGFLWYLRRRGASLLKGRSALVFWLLVLLLHILPGTPTTLLEWEHVDLLLAVRASWLVTASVLLAAGLLCIGLSELLAALRLRAGVQSRRRQRCRIPALEAGFSSRLYARPPPPARIV